MGFWAASRRHRPKAGYWELGLKGTLPLLKQNLDLRTGHKTPNPWLSRSQYSKVPSRLQEAVQLPVPIRKTPVCDHLPPLWHPTESLCLLYSQQNIPSTGTNYEDNQSWHQTAHGSVFPRLTSCSFRITIQQSRINLFYILISSLSPISDFTMKYCSSRKEDWDRSEGCQTELPLLMD